MEKVIVLDSHTSHHTEEVTSKLLELNFVPYYLPASSSYYSSIEYCWKGYKDLLNIVLAENRMDNPSLNAEVHLEPMVRQALALYATTRLRESSFYAGVNQILDTLESRA